MTLVTRIGSAMVALACTALAACGSSGNGGQALPQPTFTTTACDPASLPDGQDPRDVVCGVLTVPENRRHFTGRTVDLAVVVLRATGPSPAADPLVFLSGGPGSWAIDLYLSDFTADFAAPIQSKRDIVIFDQRGTGRSKPALDCPEVLPDTLRFAELLSPEQEAERDAKNLIACHDRLASEGNDLGAYSSAATAQDVADLVTALGYDRFNLYGLSYGTRVALTALRDLPNARIRSVVLDSVVPLQSIGLGPGPASVQRSAQTLFAACASDPGCNAAYPDLQRATFDLYDRLEAAPLTLEPTAPDGSRFTVVVTGDRLLQLEGLAFQAGFEIPLLPIFTQSTATGDTGLLSAVLGQLGMPEPFSAGLELAVICNEELPFDTADVLASADAGVDPRLVRTYSAVPYYGETLRRACAGWGEPPDPIENQPVASQVPALILAGEYDSASPPAWAHLAAETLPNSRVFEFPGFGHVELFQEIDPADPPSCAMRLIAAFLDDPSSAPDGRCVEALPPPHFVGG